jgi:hypothetical protein
MEAQILTNFNRIFTNAECFDKVLYHINSRILKCKMTNVITLLTTLCLVLCRFMWVVEAYQFFLVPSQSSGMPFYPQSASSQGACLNSLWHAPKLFVKPKKGPTMLKSESSWNLVLLPASTTKGGERGVLKAPGLD